MPGVNSALLAWEALAAGRLARGERFAFDRLRSSTKLFVDGRPEVADGFELLGGEDHFENYNYMGTLLARLPGSGEALSEELHYLLQGDERGSVLASASSLRAGLCVVRVLAANAEALYLALNRTRGRVREYLGLPPAPREVR